MTLTCPLSEIGRLRSSGMYSTVTGSGRNLILSNKIVSFFKSPRGPDEDKVDK